MRTLVIMTVMAIPSLAFSQNEEGKVIYEEKTKMDLKLLNSENEEVKSMIPQTTSAFKQLLFTAKESLYENYENLEKEDNNQLNFTTSEGGQVKIKMQQPNNEVYKDLEKQMLTDKREFMGKDFIIKEPFREFQWKLTGETKKILDFTVQKATLEDTAGVVEAWFTPEIPVSVGPLDFGNLPGLILELRLDNGKRVITATKIDLTAPDEKELVAPKKGRLVTRSEFDLIVKEKMKEMKEMYGGKGDKTMIIEH